MMELNPRRMPDSFDPAQVEATLESLGVEVVADTYSNFLCYCPFHPNMNTPAFSVDKEQGLWLCFNAACEGSAGGNLVQLILALSERTRMEALRFLDKKASEAHKPLSVRLEAMKAEEHWPILPQMKIDELHSNLWSYQPVLDYMMEERGFTEQTLVDFEVGWEPDKEMVVVPIHDADGNPLGVNGRSIVDKRFKLTKGIPRNKIMFNVHRAKREGGTVIVCESQFDTMRIHQSGFPNAVCFLGSHISKEQAAIIRRFFDRVIIMTDADEAGRKMGHTLTAMIRGVNVEWALWDWDIVYPHDAKDAGDMTDDEIRSVLQNSVSNVAYKSYWDLSD